uniref:Pleckstrin homology domain-containing family A member 7 n=1 Tax=Cacopsylla melanoneura TaxID=428564 RepID=A0A8D9AGS6_9HEMI
MFTCFWQLMSWLDPPVASPPAVFSMATLKKTPNTVTTQPSSRRRPRLSPSSTPLRSPVVKRHPSAPVTIQGWLHKQGSEGLMLWKKRWFVLSDYILFYYKGFEEEKLLGSILLPSYKISPCSSDDKVFRKFSFKAEHTNMRTYYFAAETRESMIQWMNALSLASILQNNSISWDDNRRLNNNINHSNNQGEDNDSGFHGTYRSSSRSKPNNTDPPYSKGGEYGVGGGDRYSMGGGATPQPLYANAPPKPRRLNDASPDRSPEHEYGTSSARGPSYPPQDYPPSSSSSNDPHSSPYQYPPHRAPGPPFNAERRTPDTYGRSNSNTPAHQHASGGPPQPSVTGKVISSKPKGSEYEELHNIQYRARLEQNGQIPSGQVPTKQAARPYSADFLEYELNNGRPQGGTTQPPHLPNGTVQNRLYFNPPQPAKHFSNQPRRPKSSMEFIDNDFDASFWSEENYARKMRQSAIYVSPPASQRATTPSSKHTLDEVPYPTGDIRDEIRYTASLSRVGAYGGDGGKYFQRSASARLPRTTTPDDEDDMELVSMVNSQTSSRDGSERKREESMKRLLEWKQRMLQSPLTRKSSGSSTRGTSNDLSKYYGAKQTQLLRDNLNKQEKENNMAVDNQEEDEEGGKKTEERLSRVEERAPSRIQDGRRSVNSMSRYNSYSSDDEASGSGSMMDRAGDPLPPRVRRHSTSHTKSSPPGGQGPGVGPHPPVSPTTITNCNSGDVPRASLGSKRGNTWGELSVSAGELLGRTHEELVLLLIQLRRQSAGVCKSMEISHREIETQARLADMDTTKRMEHLQKLEELKRHLLELEKQYEKGKPLVNLVDNMVKLGSLYRAGTPLQANGYNPPPPLLRERLEFNHKVQEQRLLAEERKDWDRLSPNHNQLQAKVEQLYHLDRILQEESGTLQSLQQDKEMLENALGSLRHKMHGVHASPAEVERYRRQQRLLERELSRVRSILAHNSKKLEETVAANARLESELVILRQKLQWSRREVSNGSSTSSGPSVAALEAELRRVQALVGDLQRQRQELSAQVKQLTEKSNSLSQQIRPGPTGVAGLSDLEDDEYSEGAGPVGVKRKSLHGWLETDLDSNATHDIAISPCSSFPSSPQNMNHSPLPPHSMNHSPLPPHSVNHSPLPPSSPTSVPLYVNTDPCTISNTSDVKMNDTMPGLYDGGSSSMDEGNVGDCRLTPASPQPTHPHAQPQYCKPIDISEADDRIKRFYGIIPKDKPQEIKTVRIVKRESERRQRDRGDRSGNIGIPLANGNGSVPLGNTVPLGNLLGNAATARRVTVIEESSAESGNELQHNNAATGRYSSPDADTGLLSKCSSLPRGFGRHVAPPPPPPAPRSDSIAALRNIMARSNIKYKTDHHEGSQTRGLSAREQLFGSSSEVSPATTLSSDSPSSSQVSPVFKSEAAKQIIQEVSNKENNGLAVLKPGHGQKRAIPKEKRRHHTVTSSSSSNPFRYDGLTNISRARDDLDMEVALRPRLNGAPDVVRSTLSRTDPVKFSAETIDSLLGTPGKIVIPERYIPETETLSREEKNKRFHKAEAIRKMLSESNLATCADEEPEVEFERPSTLKKKVMDERKQREHLLQLNQILAQQVMEKSKQVAGVTNSP